MRVKNSLANNKTCTECHETKERVDFCSDKTRCDGLQARCKACEKSRYVKRRAKQGKPAYADRGPPKKTPKGFRKCRRCKSIHPLDHYMAEGIQRTKCDKCVAFIQSPEHREVVRLRKKKAVDKWRFTHPEKAKAQHKAWAKKHRPAYHKRRMENEPDYALGFRIRDILSRTLRASKCIASVKSAERQLGYTTRELRDHLESKFTDGMSWENRGDWHIDHIKPISLMVSEGITDPSVVNALVNLQPLWAYDNQSKGAKYTATVI